MTGMRSGQVARAAGVTVETLRYYERRGVLAAPERTLGGHRVYPEDTVTVLRVVKAAQRLGFSLDEVTELLDAGRHRHGRVVPGLHERVGRKLADVEARIADLTVIAGTLRAAMAAGCDDLMTCAEEQQCPLPFAGLAEPEAVAGAGASPAVPSAG
ncbi:MAG TPA: MerR family transcriptional regulator [Kribbellaceae bacterium]|nr:MerR family transcriptional regulator [Kribbellaceae bacterium]